MVDSDQAVAVVLVLSFHAMREEIHRLRNELNAARLENFAARHRARALGWETAVFGSMPKLPLRRATFREVMAAADSGAAKEVDRA